MSIYILLHINNVSVTDGPHHGCQRLSAREVAVPLGRHRLPPEVVLRQGQFKKIKGSASPGFDEIAAPFTKCAVVLLPTLNRQGTEGVSVLEPFFLKSFSSRFMTSRSFLLAGSMEKLSANFEKGPLHNTNSYCMLAIRGTVYRMYANVAHGLFTDLCQEANKTPYFVIPGYSM
eukprot:354079-Pelagomonas_calceolata.AAC.4